VTSGEINPAATPHSWISDAFRALRYRNFQLFFSGQLVSLIGTWMQSVSQAWLVYRLTGSALLLGTVSFTGQFPVFLMATFGGVVADRKDRQRVIIVTQTASMLLALILSVLTLTHVVRVWHIMVLAGLLGVINAFDIPARQSFLVDMVGKEDLINAIALNSSMFNGARIIGPAIAGILVAWIGEGWCFFANGVSYLAVIAGLLMMRLPPFVKQVTNVSPFEHVLEGFRYVRDTKPVRDLLILVGLVSLVAMPYSVLMPIFADRVLHGGARALGILMGATGVGALLGALALAVRRGVKGLGKWVGAASISFGVSLICFSASRWFWLSVVLLLPVGFGMMLQNSGTNTLIQAMVPDRLRGRAMSAYSMMFMGMAPIGALLAGAVAHRLGAPLTVGMGGVLAIGGGTVFLIRLGRITEEARALLREQALGGGELRGVMKEETIAR
jgi:MFS family permease